MSPQEDKEDGALRPASCELLNTRPMMLGGVPRLLAGIIACGGFMAASRLESLWDLAGVAAGTAMVWFFVREVVSRDLWGFDILVAWIFTDGRFLDASHRGGARLSASPLRPRRPFEGGFGAARRAR